MDVTSASVSALKMESPVTTPVSEQCFSLRWQKSYSFLGDKNEGTRMAEASWHAVYSAGLGWVGDGWAIDQTRKDHLHIHICINMLIADSGIHACVHLYSVPRHA